jgi:divalent metal cation (Fe/Co/Zn/Cd) transporter
MGSEILVDMHILVNGELTVKEGHDIAENVKSAVKERVKNVIDVTVHVEPWEK